MRQLKKPFPLQWKYARHEGSNHGFIHPTPWDERETEEAVQKLIAEYGLHADILPCHSTPLIIHHASTLGDWIRGLEKAERIQYKRYDSIIGWWQIGDRCTL